MNYQAKADKVAKAIKKNGIPIVLGKITSNYDPETRKDVPSITPENGFCIEDKLNAMSLAALKWHPEGTVLSSMRKLLCVEITDPQPGETITIGGKDVMIKQVTPVKPADVVLLNEVYVI